MRITLVTDMAWPAGGAEQSILVLREALVARGHSVQIIATDKGTEGRDDLFADVRVPAVSGWAVARLCRKAFHPRAYRAMRRAFKEFRPHVVHYHTIGELSPACLFAARRLPFLLTVHGPEDFTVDLNRWHIAASDYRNGSYRRRDLRLSGRVRCLYLRAVQRPIYLVALRRCRGLVAPSVFLAGVLEEEAHPSRITHIYNGCELPAGSAVVPGGPLLFVGRLEAVKGADVLIRALARARLRVPAARLDVVGDGSERASLEKLVAELGLEDAVTFHGWRSRTEVVSSLQACCALVIPSVWPENLPTVALEAIGVGRPVIGSRVGGIPELVVDGVTGFITAPYDEEALADCIGKVASDPALCERMGAAARETAGRYAVAPFVDRVLELYEHAWRPAT